MIAAKLTASEDWFWLMATTNQAMKIQNTAVHHVPLKKFSH